MAALSAARLANYIQELGEGPIPSSREFPVAANAVIWQGGLVALNSSGYAKAAAPGDTKVVGVAEASVDNTGGSNGAQNVRIRRGPFTFFNKGGDLVTQADIASPALCYVEDDQTVRHTATGSIPVGRPVFIGTNGQVTVEIY